MLLLCGNAGVSESLAKGSGVALNSTWLDRRALAPTDWAPSAVKPEMSEVILSIKPSLDGAAAGLQIRLMSSARSNDFP